MNRDLPENFDVDYELTRFVRRVRERSMARLGEIHEELDYNTFLLFIAICDAPDGIRASELADSMRVHKSTVSRAVATLERLDLVDRVPHPEDGRAQLLSVPDDARDLMDAYRRRSHVWLSELVSDWTADELTSFAQQLGRLNDAAEDRRHP